jgi:hypothetical protein
LLGGQKRRWKRRSKEKRERTKKRHGRRKSVYGEGLKTKLAEEEEVSWHLLRARHCPLHI